MNSVLLKKVLPLEATTPTPLGYATGFPRLQPYQVSDLLALRQARRILRAEESRRCGGQTQGYSEMLFQNWADYSAVASTAAEATLLGTINRQPSLSAGYFLDQKGIGRTVRLQAAGVFSTTGTPTLTFQIRMGTTEGSSSLAGASLAVSAAITTGSGVTNTPWELTFDFTCSVPAHGTGNATVFGNGWVMSPTGFASPFIYPMIVAIGTPQTWTQVFNATLNQFINLSVTWSASSASNTITAKKVYAFGFN